MPTNMETEGYAIAWGVEAYTRKKSLDMTIRDLQRRESDWILLSDLDEILGHPSILQAMKTPIRLQVLHRLLERPRATRYRERASHDTQNGAQVWRARVRRSERALSMIGGNQWRDVGNYMREHCNSTAATLVEDACWHCSWRFDKMESYVDKMESYSHTEHNNPQSQTQEWTIDHVNRGINLFEYDWVSYNPADDDHKRGNFASCKELRVEQTDTQISVWAENEILY
ncbi:hypothetical protein BGZ81_011751 [Podila clonocystis]|nr:hypothetical protein BGZ81_011751 [Podila clonocystis]